MNKLAPKRLLSGIHQPPQRCLNSTCIFTHPGHGQFHFTDSFSQHELVIRDDNVATEVAFLSDGGFSLRISNSNEVQDVATAANQLVIDSKWIATTGGEIIMWISLRLITMQYQMIQTVLMQSCEARGFKGCTISTGSVLLYDPEFVNSTQHTTPKEH